MTARETFWNWLATQQSPRVLEIGTRAWDGNPPRHHRSEVLRVCPSAKWTGCDAQPGAGVDVVADAHRLSQVFPAGSFDCLVCVSTLEHLARPWVASAEMAWVTRAGGLLWAETHQSFPVHGYPSDYFRFTAEGLREVFSAEAGWDVIEADYSYPAKVVPLANIPVWNFEAPAWLNVGVTARKIK